MGGETEHHANILKLFFQFIDYSQLKYLFLQYVRRKCLNELKTVKTFYEVPSGYVEAVIWLNCTNSRKKS